MLTKQENMYLTIQCFSHLTNVRTLQSKKMTQVGLLTEDQHKECAMERLSIKPVSGLTIFHSGNPT